MSCLNHTTTPIRDSYGTLEFDASSNHCTSLRPGTYLFRTRPYAILLLSYPSAPFAISEALPPAAAVLMVSVRSVTKRSR
jgi:hypothetical protein